MRGYLAIYMRSSKAPYQRRYAFFTLGKYVAVANLYPLAVERG